MHIYSTYRNSIQESKSIYTQTESVTHTHFYVTRGPYQFWVSEGLEEVHNAGLEQDINQMGLVRDGVLERCHHSAADVGSRVGQVLLSCGEGGGIAESSACTYMCVLCVHMCVTV